MNEENLLYLAGLVVLAVLAARLTPKVARGLGVPKWTVSAGVALAAHAIAN